MFCEVGREEAVDSKNISEIFQGFTHCTPQKIERCAVGIGNQVYIVTCDNIKYVFRCSTEENAYADTIYWLNELSALNLSVPKVLLTGECGNYHYLILNFIEGKDIGLVYSGLTKSEKRKIARDVIDMQNKVAQLPLKHIDGNWSWIQYIDEMLDRARVRIGKNGYFDIEKVERLKSEKDVLKDYFLNIRPIAYLDDISTKNLLIHNGHVSGFIDIDWMGVGDSLTFIALTFIALLNMKMETDYVDYLLEYKKVSALEKKAFLFYSLLFCVDFMGERGTQFLDKTIEVNGEIVNRLNQIYDTLWEKWCFGVGDKDK